MIGKSDLPNILGSVNVFRFQRAHFARPAAKQQLKLDHIGDHWRQVPTSRIDNRLIDGHDRLGLWCRTSAALQRIDALDRLMNARRD
jgi:hypothetical protein